MAISGTMCLTFTFRNGLVFDTSEELSQQLFDLLKGYPGGTAQLDRMRGALSNIEVPSLVALTLLEVFTHLAKISV